MFVRLLLTLVLAGSVVSLSRAQPSAPDVDVSGIPVLIDSVLTTAIEKHGVPGAVVALVHDTSIVHVAGAGLADVQAARPVDPERTLFRVASISKMITATAIMQLVERGVLDLDRDINEYLTTVHVPRTFDEPITLRHLLTHTAGFDDRYIGKSSYVEESPEEFGAFIGEFMPRRLLPPGRISTYSNYGIALAAYVAQEVIEEDFAEYVHRNVFMPLEMPASTFRVPEESVAQLSAGYLEHRQGVREVPFTWIRDYPAGQAVTTAQEFAHFMIAHLNQGTFRDRKILEPETARSMQQVQFTHHSGLVGGLGWAFNISSYNGRKVVAHDGGYVGIRARMWLFPEEKIGLFVACNMMHEACLQDISGAITDRLLPDVSDASVALPVVGTSVYETRADRYAGRYRLTRYPHASFEKIALLVGLFPFEMEIRLGTNGMIEMDDHLGNTRRLFQMTPLFFRSVDDDYAMAFEEDGRGRVAYVFTNGSTAMERLTWYETVRVNRIFFMLAQLAFIGMLVMFGVRRFNAPRRIFRRKGDPLLRRALPVLSGTVGALFLLHTLALVLVMAFLVPAEDLVTGFAHGVPSALFAAQAFSVAAFVVWGALVLVYLGAFVRNTVSTLPAAGYAAVLLLFTTYVLFLDYWNLLGWRF